MAIAKYFLLFIFASSLTKHLKEGLQELKKLPEKKR